MGLSGRSSTDIKTIPTLKSRDDLAKILNTTADDDTPREDSTVNNKQVEDVMVYYPIILKRAMKHTATIQDSLGSEMFSSL